MTITCPYCNQPAKLVGGDAIYKNRPDLAKLKFWRCDSCDAHVGCHKPGNGPGYARGDGTVPLGRLANAELRMWKGNAHAVFDGYWSRLVSNEIASLGNVKGIKQRNRTAAYMRLARDLGVDPKDCHIGMFDVEQCKRVVRTVNGWRLGDQVI